MADFAKVDQAYDELGEKLETLKTAQQREADAKRAADEAIAAADQASDAVETADMEAETAFGQLQTQLALVGVTEPGTETEPS